jgi:hypothetical protein
MDLYTFAIFLVVLFFYIHITAQYKKSQDLEIYETDLESNAGLQEICEVRQPFLFEYHSEDFFEKIQADKLTHVAGSHDIRIKEIVDYEKEETSIDYVMLPWSSARTLIDTDSSIQYFTENNNDFIEESGIVGVFSKNDVWFKPNWTCCTTYDVMMGAKGLGTPLRYHTAYRHFIVVQNGKIRVKMTPWKSAKYVYPIQDFENYEFWSPVNIWKPQKKYLHETDKLRFIDFDVTAGHVLYVPPYWFYSIQYVEEGTLLTGFTYHSVMNVLANTPNWIRYYMHQTNKNKKMVIKKEVDVIDDTEESVVIAVEKES